MGLQENIKLLLSSGADKTLENKEKLTPRDLVAPFDGCIQVLEEDNNQSVLSKAENALFETQSKIPQKKSSSFRLKFGSKNKKAAITISNPTEFSKLFSASNIYTSPNALTPPTSSLTSTPNTSTSPEPKKRRNTTSNV